MYPKVQEWIRHMHSGTPKTFLFTALYATMANGTSRGSCSHMMPGAVYTLAAPHGVFDILYGESLQTFGQLLCLSVCLIIGYVCPCNHFE